MNDVATKRFVAVQESRMDLHAIRLDALAAVRQAFDEVEQRLLLLENNEAARAATRAA